MMMLLKRFCQQPMARVIRFHISDIPFQGKNSLFEWYVKYREKEHIFKMKYPREVCQTFWYEN